MTSETIEQRASRLVHQEVTCCLSAVVSRLQELEDEQAIDLGAPVPDFEEAAIQEGWKENEDGQWLNPDFSDESYNSAEELCQDQNINPYDREVFEFWAVSNWLGNKLTIFGEKVDSDFHGLTVWARTTTGQAIAIDYVIEQIVRSIMKPE